MFFFIITSFITAATSILLGIIVYSRDKKNPVNKLFGFYAFAVFVWSFSYGVWLLQKNFVDAFFWSRMLNIGATLIPIAYLHWVLVFLKEDKKKINKIILIVGYVLTFIFLSFSFSGYYIKDVTQVSFFPYWPQANWLYFLYVIFSYCGMVFYGSYLTYKKVKVSTGVYKEQIKYALVGSVIGFIGGASNFPLMLGIDLFPPIGNPFVIAYPIFFAYAIIVHRLLDIKFILRRSSVYLASLSTILILAISAQYFSIVSFTNSATWINVLILIFAVSFFPMIKNCYYHLANKYFFSSLYDGRKVIADLSDKLRYSLDVNKISKYISFTLRNLLHIQAVGILIYNEEKNYYEVQYNKGFKTSGKKTFLVNKKPRNSFIKQHKVIVVEEIKEQNYAKYKKVIDILDDYGVEVVIPLNFKNKIIGIIVLGLKESKDIYNNEDLSVLKIIGAQSATAIQNALLYEDTKDFSVKLEKEVKKATADLITANKQLKKLDAAKSEFISIASHQLRTPLTIIKGYISMMLEGNFGELTVGEVDSLEKVYISNERLIRLVENLLNISRIESGRVQFNFTIMRMEDLVVDVVEELSRNVKTKDLSLSYKLPKNSLPKVKFDEEKIRQVVMNLVDNAIKYTEKGSIVANLKQVDDNIEFCVLDTGIGISQEDLAGLFKKFFRGSGTSLLHTEGTGLGLYVAYQIIEAHGGKIWAESDGENKGSKFCFRLPIYHDA